MHHIIHSDQAPAAIGPYSQAVTAGNTVYLSGQLGLDPKTLQLVADDVALQAEQMFKNIKTIAEAAGGKLSAIVKMTIYLIDMEHFAMVNKVMEQFFQPPYPARVCLAVKQLPKAAFVEADAIMVLNE